MQDYVKALNKHFELFSNYDPKTIFAFLIEMADSQASKYTLSKEKYQIKLFFAED